MVNLCFAKSIKKIMCIAFSAMAREQVLSILTMNFSFDRQKESRVKQRRIQWLVHPTQKRKHNYIYFRIKS